MVSRYVSRACRPAMLGVEQRRAHGAVPHSPLLLPHMEAGRQKRPYGERGASVSRPDIAARKHLLK